MCSADEKIAMTNMRKMQKWITKGKPFYSADCIPQWAKDELTAHWSGSYHDRMKELSGSVKRFYSVREPFCVAKGVIYFTDSGRDKLIDYVLRRGLMRPDKAQRFKEDMLGLEDKTDSFRGRLAYVFFLGEGND